MAAQDGTDDPLCGAHAEFFEKVRLIPGPRDERVQLAGVESAVSIRQRPQRPPSRCLSLHAQPQYFQLFKPAEGGPAQEVAVELQQPAFSPTHAA